MRGSEDLLSAGMQLKYRRGGKDTKRVACSVRGCSLLAADGLFYSIHFDISSDSSSLSFLEMSSECLTLVRSKYLDPHPFTLSQSFMFITYFILIEVSALMEWCQHIAQKYTLVCGLVGPQTWTGCALQPKHLPCSSICNRWFFCALNQVCIQACKPIGNNTSV